MHLLTLLLVMLFALVIAYFCYSVYFYGGRWVANPYNPRISSQKQHVIMGTLTDRDGTVLAYTDEDGQRRYNNSADTRKAVCQVVGDSGGKVSTGADTFHAQFLLGFRSSIFERLADAFTGTTQRGDDVRLTISERLSRYISEHFPKGKRGAVVVLNYKTNEILAMVSMPQFDPTNMDAALANESAGALIMPLRAPYPPGSTFKIVTLASALENLPDLNDFAFDCTGYYPVGNYSVTDGSAHGVQSLSDAFAHSCNTTFAALSQDLGYEMLGQTAEEMGFNENFMFSDLIVYNSSYPIDDLSAEDLAWSAIGQGRVLATPLHMALIASTIANRGVMNEPRLIAQVTTAQGGNRALLSHAGGRRVISEDVADRLESEMIRVVKSGTGKRAALDNGYTVAGKTGSAEASNDKSIESHAWFVVAISPMTMRPMPSACSWKTAEAAAAWPRPWRGRRCKKRLIWDYKDHEGGFLTMRRMVSGLMLLACLTLVSFSALAAGTTVTTFTPFADMDFAAQGYMDLITAWENETGNLVEDYSGLEDDVFMQQMQEMVAAGRADIVVVPLGSGLAADKLVGVDELLAAAPDCGAKKMAAMAESDGSVLLTPVRLNWESLYIFSR